MTLIKVEKTFNSQLWNQHFSKIKYKKTLEINIYCFFKKGKQIMSIPLIFQIKNKKFCIKNIYLYIYKMSYHGIRVMRGKSALIIYIFYFYEIH